MSQEKQIVVKRYNVHVLKIFNFLVDILNLFSKTWLCKIYFGELDPIYTFIGEELPLKVVVMMCCLDPGKHINKEINLFH